MRHKLMKPDLSAPLPARRGERSMEGKRSSGAEIAPELDPIIHERIRLGIISALAVNDSLAFADLRRLLNTTDGNLSVHARKLEDAGYIACEKFFEGRQPKTEYRLTPAGRRALERYMQQMEGILRATRGE